jgi:hypothetical protein
MTPARRVVAGLALWAGVYALVVRPRLLRWGASDEEVRQPYPGADLVAGGRRGATMAVTIDAPPSRVWPWLVQMGCDRAGWYSWDRLDNAGLASAERIHPEWQTRTVGDRLASTPSGRAWFVVAALEPERFLGLRALLDWRGQPFDPAGPRATLLCRRPVGLPADGVARGAHPAGGQRLRGRPAAAPTGARGPCLLGTGALGHADAPVCEPEAAGRAPAVRAGQGVAGRRVDGTNPRPALTVPSVPAS